jgi:REP element-mobilizing transposase RayT
MAKPPKQYHEGYWYHLFTRGLPEVPLFINDEEREWFLARLDRVFSRYRVGLSALCLMDTHYHALVQMGPVRLGRALNSLHNSYADHVNNVRNREDSVFGTHPETKVVLDDSYLLQLVAYIHNNPVEAGMVDNPDDYKWSTDGLYRSGKWEKRELEAWLWPPNFRDEGRRRIYLEQFEEPPDEPEGGKNYYGTEQEWLELEKRDDDREDRFRDRRDRPEMDEIVRQVANENNVLLENLRSPGRKPDMAEIRHEAMVQLYEAGYGSTEIGRFFNRSKSSVHYALKKMRDSEDS